MNYTKPDNLNHNDSPGDWLLSSLLFTRALGLLLDENIGVVVDLKGDMVELSNDLWELECSRVIIFNSDEQLHVIPADDRTDLEEGTLVQMIDQQDLLN